MPNTNDWDFWAMAETMRKFELAQRQVQQQMSRWTQALANFQAELVRVQKMEREVRKGTFAIRMER